MIWDKGIDRVVKHVISWLRYRHLNEGKILLGTLEIVSQEGVQCTVGFIVSEEREHYNYARRGETSYEQMIAYENKYTLYVNRYPFFVSQNIQEEGIKYHVGILFFEGLSR